MWPSLFWDVSGSGWLLVTDRCLEKGPTGSCNVRVTGVRIYYLHSSHLVLPCDPLRPQLCFVPICKQAVRINLNFSIYLENLFLFRGLFYVYKNYQVFYSSRPPLWSSGQSFCLQIQRSRVRFPALPDFLSSSGSGTGSTQPREVN